MPVTNAFSIYQKGKYAKQVTITFPGQTPVTVTSNNLYVPEAYRKAQDYFQYNYGVISLAGNSDGFGWSTLLQNSELENRSVTVCGYDARDTEMWKADGEIAVLPDRPQLIYSVGLGGIGNQFGSPVYMSYKGNWTVVSIFSYSISGFIGPRFVPTMVKDFLKLATLKTVSFQSLYFPKNALRCDGSAVTYHTDGGGGIVNCQYDHVGALEKFIIFSLEAVPSNVAEETEAIVFINTTIWNDVYLRMDGSNVTEYNAEGSGVVNSQFMPLDEYGMFVITRHRNSFWSYYSIRSLFYSKSYLRLEAIGVDHYRTGGEGTVNCQYWLKPNDIGNYERFNIIEQS